MLESPSPCASPKRFLQTSNARHFLPGVLVLPHGTHHTKAARSHADYRSADVNARELFLPIRGVADSAIINQPRRPRLEALMGLIFFLASSV